MAPGGEDVNVKKSIGKLAFEIAVVCMLGTMLGLSVNALRADHNHVVIGRNYFPKLKVVPSEPPPVSVAPTVAEPAGGEAADPVQAVEDELDPSKLGVRLLSFEQAQEIYFHENTDAGIYLFVDARDDDNFNEGHIPGAAQVDHYRIDNYLPKVNDRIQAAELVVVYCHGGDCEDSFFLCQALIDHGIPPENLRVFKGGMEAWEENGMEIESGEGM